MDITRTQECYQNDARVGSFRYERQETYHEKLITVPHCLYLLKNRIMQQKLLHKNEMERAEPFLFCVV